MTAETNETRDAQEERATLLAEEIALTLGLDDAVKLRAALAEALALNDMTLDYRDDEDDDEDDEDEDRTPTRRETAELAVMLMSVAYKHAGRIVLDAMGCGDWRLARNAQAAANIAWTVIETAHAAIEDTKRAEDSPWRA